MTNQRKQEKYPNLNDGAPPNNCHADLWKTSEKIQAACEEYCIYLRAGRDKKWYKHDKKVINHYMEKHAADFPPEKVEEALSEGFAMLEETYMKAAKGETQGAVPSMMIFLMKNKLKWRDRIDTTTDDKEMPGMQVTIKRE